MVYKIEKFCGAQSPNSLKTLMCHRNTFREFISKNCVNVLWNILQWPVNDSNETEEWHHSWSRFYRKHNEFERNKCKICECVGFRPKQRPNKQAIMNWLKNDKQKDGYLLVDFRDVFNLMVWIQFFENLLNHFLFKKDNNKSYCLEMWLLHWFSQMSRRDSI